VGRGDIHLGVVVSINDSEKTLIVHVLEGRDCASDITYLPLWGHQVGKGGERRMQSCPEGYTAELRDIESGAVQGVVTLKGNHKLSEDSRVFMESLGVDTMHNGK